MSTSKGLLLGLPFLSILSLCFFCPVPSGHAVSLEGAPRYVSGETFGGVLSDFGSHFGVKATQDDHFGGIAYYSALTSFTNGSFGTGGIAFLLGGDRRFVPAETRHVVFWPYGIEEMANDGDLQAKLKVGFLDEDVLYLACSLQNGGPSAISVTPELWFRSERFKVKQENMFSGFVPSFTLGRLVRKTEDAALLETPFNDVSLPPVRILSAFRAVAPTFKVVGVTEDHGAMEATQRILGEPERLEAGASLSFCVFLTFETNGQRALSRALQAKRWALMGKLDPWGATKEAWEGFFRGLPKPHTDAAPEAELFRLAHAALRMGLYAPRGRMPGFASVPSKPVFNFFFAWDTPLQAIGQMEWGEMPWLGGDGVEMAKENMTTLFQGQLSSGMLPYMVNEDLSSVYFWQTQPPVQGWVVQKVLEREPQGSLKEAFASEMLKRGERYVTFFENQRDTNHNGLMEYSSAIESGWDDTPRYTWFNLPTSNLGGFIPKPGIDSVELNAWLHAYMETLTDLSQELQDAEGAQAWRRKVEGLAQRIESNLWSEKDKAWMDKARDGKFVQTLTPAVWFPAFLGVSRDEERIRTVIEEHLLNPEEFFGAYPIPTVAYNDPAYNHDGEGMYWRGQVWIVTAYSGLETLFRYGYEKEAKELKQRLIGMLAGKGGVFENYNAQTGEVGHTFSFGLPAVHQFGWTAAFSQAILLDRHQRVRSILSKDEAFSGYIKRAEVLSTGEPFYEVVTNGFEVPFVQARSLDAKPLLTSGAAEFRFSDPYGNFGQESIQFLIKGKPYEAMLGEPLTVQIP